MPSDNRSRRSWWLRLCMLLSFVLALGWVHSAFAAVPMCGIHAQTVPAPPIGTAANSDALNVECPSEDAPPLRAAGIPNREAPQKLVLPEQPVRALPILPRLASAPLSGRVSAAASEHEICATGFARSIDRPPRG